MNIEQLKDAVYELTNRPDLTALTERAIRAATLKAHTMEFFAKDIYECVLATGESARVQSIDVYTAISNFRAPKYMRILNADGSLGAFLDKVEPTEVVDYFGNQRTNIFYVAGRHLEVRSAVAFNRIVLGCYVFPITTAANYSSWIADLYEDAIVFEAVYTVSKHTDKAEQAKSYKEAAAEARAAILLTEVTSGDL